MLPRAEADDECARPGRGVADVPVGTAAVGAAKVAPTAGKLARPLCGSPDAQGGGVALPLLALDGEAARAELQEGALPEAALPPPPLNSSGGKLRRVVNGGRKSTRGGVVVRRSRDPLDGEIDRPTTTGEVGRIGRMPLIAGLA